MQTINTKDELSKFFNQYQYHQAMQFRDTLEELLDASDENVSYEDTVVFSNIAYAKESVDIIKDAGDKVLVEVEIDEQDDITVSVSY